jgi:hypothetical protein
MTIADLPLRQLTALLVRVVQRIRPLVVLSKTFPHKREVTGTIDQAIELAGQFSSGRLDTLPDDYTRDRDKLTKLITPREPPSAKFAAEAVAVFAIILDTCVTVRELVPSTAGQMLTRGAYDEAERLVAVVGRAVEKAGTPAERERFWRAAEKDFKAIQQRMKRSVSGIIGVPLDPSESGPLGQLWPSGAPAWYRREGETKSPPATGRRAED